MPSQKVLKILLTPSLGVKPEYTGPIDVIQKLVKNNGPSGLYKGLPSTLMTRVHCWAYFSGQEACRQYFVSKSGKENYTLTVGEQFLTGGAAGTCYWLFAFPFDVVKNRMMSQADLKERKYPTVWSCWKHIWKVDGIKGFTRGFIPCALRTLPANGATWVVLKEMKEILEKFDFYFSK
jgi:solute carrier family 25 (mitochondrial carnitine/acylcarnitine transporter), member 20/29